MEDKCNAIICARIGAAQESSCRLRTASLNVCRNMKHSRGPIAPWSLFALCFLLCFSACKSSTPTPSAAMPYYPAKLAEMDAVIDRAIADKKCPGGVLWLEHHGASYHKAYGNRALAPAVEPMTEDTLFDAASLTKVVACTPAVMLLVERGQVNLDERVQTYISEFKGDGKEAITVRQLMLHLSGLRGDIETRTDWHGQQTAIQKACAEKLLSAPGTAFRYSDINFSCWVKSCSASAISRWKSLSPARFISR